MRKFLLASLCAAVMVCPSAAWALDSAPHQHVGLVGGELGVGVPTGAYAGLSVRPALYWLRLGVAGTYDVVAPGIMGSMTLQPIKYAISPTLTGQIGHQFQGSVPGVDKSPDFSMTYENLLLGLEMGSMNFRFYLRGGLTHLNVSTANFASKSLNLKDTTLTVGDPSASGWAAPSVSIGSVFYF